MQNTIVYTHLNFQFVYKKKKKNGKFVEASSLFMMRYILYILLSQYYDLCVIKSNQLFLFIIISKLSSINNNCFLEVRIIFIFLSQY